MVLVGKQMVSLFKKSSSSSSSSSSRSSSQPKTISGPLSTSQSHNTSTSSRQAAPATWSSPSQRQQGDRPRPTRSASAPERPDVSDFTFPPPARGNKAKTTSTAGSQDNAATQSDPSEDASTPSTSRDSTLSSSHWQSPYLQQDGSIDSLALRLPPVKTRPRSGSEPTGYWNTRHRSHFSIPDLMITDCDEEGAEAVYEVKLEEEKRRTKLYTDVAEARLRSQQGKGSLGSGPVEGPSSLKAMSKAVSSATSFVFPGPAASSSDSSISSSAEATGVKRSRKPSFPVLFGRKNSSDRYTDGPFTVEPESPVRSASPYQQSASAFDSSGSLPLSSEESLPSASSDQAPSLVMTSPPSSPPRKPAARTSTVTPGATAAPLPVVRAPRQLTKKEIKSREKEELAMMKELQKVDKMVREHDAKAKRQREKEEKKNQKKRQQHASAGAEASTAKSAGRKRISIFTAGGKVASIGSAANTRRGAPSLKLGDAKTVHAAASTPVTSKNSGSHSSALQQSSDSNKDSDESDRPMFSEREWADLPRVEMSLFGNSSPVYVDVDEKGEETDAGTTSWERSVERAIAHAASPTKTTTIGSRPSTPRSRDTVYTYRSGSLRHRSGSIRAGGRPSSKDGVQRKELLGRRPAGPTARSSEDDWEEEKEVAADLGARRYSPPATTSNGGAPRSSQSTPTPRSVAIESKKRQDPSSSVADSSVDSWTSAPQRQMSSGSSSSDSTSRSISSSPKTSPPLGSAPFAYKSRSKSSSATTTAGTFRVGQVIHRNSNGSSDSTEVPLVGIPVGSAVGGSRAAKYEQQQSNRRPVMADRL